MIGEREPFKESDMSTTDSTTGQSSSRTDHIREDAANIGHNLRDMGEQVRDAAKEKYEGIKDRASDYYEQGRVKAQEWEGALEDYIRANPLQSVLIAAGTGLLLGALLSRR
jgi:ElaB/YqjD/DUF883 family membrane-anchored ribosome-binding protein